MTKRQEILNYSGGMVAVLLVSVLGFLAYALVYVEIPEQNNNTLTILVGILSANIGTIVGYFFGSSVASKKQEETISTLAETAKTAQVSLSAVSPQPPVPTIEIKPGDSVEVKAEESKTT